jgi:hypothetical protein
MKRWVRRRSKRATTVTVLAAAVAEVTMIIETIKTATIVKVRNLLSGVGRLPHLAIQPRSAAESSAFNDLIIAV